MQVLNHTKSDRQRFALKLADGTFVTGFVAGEYGRGLLPRAGGFGRLRLAIANAEEGFPTGLVEPAPGCATLFVGDALDAVVVDLRGAEVLS